MGMIAVECEGTGMSKYGNESGNIPVRIKWERGRSHKIGNEIGKEWE